MIFDSKLVEGRVYYDEALDRLLEYRGVTPHRRDMYTFMERYPRHQTVDEDAEYCEEALIEADLRMLARLDMLPQPTQALQRTDEHTAGVIVMDIVLVVAGVLAFLLMAASFGWSG